MLRQPIHASSERPSFFYLLMADSCFQRAASTATPGASNALRDIGRDYIMKATEVTSVREPGQGNQPRGSLSDCDA
jgi:hypothetical protein